MKEIEQFEFPIRAIEPIKNSDNVELFRKHLPKGKYDIHFVIQLLMVIHDKIESMKMNPKDIAFTMCDSLKRLIANLEVEKQQYKGKNMQELEQQKASPELMTFFKRLLKLKEYVRQEAFDTNNEVLKKIFQELEEIIKEKE